MQRARDIRVACVGDSITQGTPPNDYPAFLQAALGRGWELRNFGNSGKTMIKTPVVNSSYWEQGEFAASRAFLPNVVVLMLGTNDAKTHNWNGGQNTFAADYAEMLSIYQQLASRPAVYAMLPPPAVLPSFTISPTVIENEIVPIIRRVVSGSGVALIDLHSAFASTDPVSMMVADGIHPNEKGSRFIAKCAELVIRKHAMPHLS